MRFGLMDCNNFFVSCERLFRPDLVGKPVAVLSSNDGCIVARSEEVKALGIPMGVPYFQVKDICTKEGITLFSGNLTLYRDISARVMATLAAEVGDTEIYSIDEAFFNLSPDMSETDMHQIRERIWRDVGIPVSIGVAATKTLAKYASKLGKKANGVHVLTPTDWNARQAGVACGDIWNIGGKTARALRDLEITTVAELLATPRVHIADRFGVHGVRVYDELRGVSVHPLHERKLIDRQSLASTRSLASTTKDGAVLESAVARHVEQVAAKLRQRDLLASALIVQLQPARHGDWFLHRASVEITFEPPTNATATLLSAATAAVRQHQEPDVPYKKTGVIATGLVPSTGCTPTLFAEPEDTRSSATLDALIDTINARHGGAAVTYATTQQSLAITKSELRSPHYTTLWKDIPSIQAK